jgi:signal-transduction protein with cAMP-binding, CBS, and nucleotidyltransferase domain
MKELFLKDAVSADFISVGGDWSLSDAITHMNTQKASYILVVKDDKPEGIITERDMVGFLQESFEGVTWKDIPVDHIMTTPVTSVGWDTTVFEALVMTQGGKVRHIPVVDDEGRVIGVLTQDQLVTMLYKYCEEHEIW